MISTSLATLQSWLPLSLQSRIVGVDGNADCHVNGMVTDSRAVVADNLFVALRGERFDAHDFLDQVVEQGAAAVVVDHIPEKSENLTVPALLVTDTTVALGAIANGWRRQFDLPLIGVTGSNGKTTVKEMIASILMAAFGDEGYLSTRGNLNNEIGVPLTLQRLTASHQAAVIELGMNHPGEIALLSTIAQPTVALVNNAQREHQEFMVSVEAVAEENGAVIRALPAQGIAVFPADDTYTALWRSYAAHAAACITFGFSDDADVRCTYRADTFGSDLEVTAQGKTFSLHLDAAGEHNVRNALAAIACTLAIGIDVPAIVRGLESFAPYSGRLQRKFARRPNCTGALVIDDTYNANPDSVRAAIDVLAQAAAPRLLVLGDMGEVGDQGKQFHQEIGAYAAQRGITHLLTLGALAVDASAAFGGRGQHFSDIAALIAAVDLIMTPDVTVLVKGSRFMKMERVVQHLVNDGLDSHAAITDPSNLPTKGAH